jgi:hypothetical protein
MNEAKIRERLHQAVGEASFPEYLPSRVEARLKHPGRDQSPPARRANGPLLLGLGRIGSLVAALLVVLLIAALVVGVSVWRNGDLLNHPRPAGQDPAIKHYQAETSADLQRFVDTQPPSCNGPSWADAACLAQILPRTAALQHWLDDLNRTQPPARFAALVALMRRHLTLALSAQARVLAAFRAKDDQAFVDAGGVTLNETDPLAHQAETIIESRQATIPLYKSFIRSDRTYLLACGGCEQLIRQGQVVCEASRTPACVDEFAALRLQLEIFVSDLASTSAPDSLSAEDAKLQADLMAADAALVAMESAASGHDQVGLQAGHDQLLRALRGVDADAAGIAGRD